MSNLTPRSTNTTIIPPGISETSNSRVTNITPPSSIQPPITTTTNTPYNSNFNQIRAPYTNQIRAPSVNQIGSPSVNQARVPSVNQEVVTDQSLSSPVPVTSSKPPPTENYWATPDLCHPGRQPYKCPVGIYIFLLVLLAVINIWAIFRAPRINNNGKQIAVSTIWWAAVAGVAFHLVFGLMIGWYLFEQCRSCNQENRHIIFLLAVATPIILGIIAGIIIGSIMNIGFLWTASREPNPESSNINA